VDLFVLFFLVQFQFFCDVISWPETILRHLLN
jgi:hypothetical protein